MAPVNGEDPRRVARQDGHLLARVDVVDGDDHCIARRRKKPASGREGHGTHRFDETCPRRFLISPLQANNSGKKKKRPNALLEKPPPNNTREKQKLPPPTK